MLACALCLLVLHAAPCIVVPAHAAPTATAAAAAATAGGCSGFTQEADACTRAVTLGRLQDGEDIARLVIASAPSCADAWQCLGAVMYNRGDLRGATAAFAKVRAACTAGRTLALQALKPHTTPHATPHATPHTMPHFLACTPY